MPCAFPSFTLQIQQVIPGIAFSDLDHDLLALMKFLTVFPLHFRHQQKVRQKDSIPVL
jgi:hypothetical protein